MDHSKVRTLMQEILGLAGIDQALQALSDQELDALIERTRSRGPDLPGSTVAVVIGEALRAVRAQM